MSKVSIIIPNYNHARFLEQRIQSILDQTYQNFEIIYLDDASTDDSNEIFSKFIPDSRIKAIYNQTNSGSPFKQWNKGLREVNGKYVWIAESDDYADPSFLETLVRILDNHTNVGVAYCQSYQVDEQNNVLATLRWWTDDLSKERWRNDFINNGVDECASYLVFKNTIPNASAVLTRRSVFEKIDIANSSLKLCGDWFNWVQLLLQSDLAFSAEALNYFRVHKNCVRYSTSEARYLAERIQLFTLINQRVPLSNATKETMKDQLVREWMVLTFAKERKFDFDLYHAAKACEPMIELRFFRQMGTSVMRKLKRRISLSTPTEY